jgi:hypothetical protein
MPFLVLGICLLPAAALIYNNLPLEPLKKSKEGDEQEPEDVSMRTLMRNPQVPQTSGGGRRVLRALCRVAEGRCETARRRGRGAHSHRLERPDARLTPAPSGRSW